MAHKAFIISHTHWDREWYQPFQEFRLRLVKLVDKLLDIMASDPDYRFFMLDGQTVVLEDYLEVRPEREAEIRALVQSGRLLIGPWFILPDEFLVSPEAIVRNLLLGDRIARRFGAKMNAGYVPDQFGHISQLPHILRGFGMTEAVLWRGLDDHPFELRWRGPGGDEVLLIYLRGGYGNAAHLPAGDPDAFAAAVEALIADMAAHSHSGCLPLMNGTDHMEPHPGLPAAIRHTSARLPSVEMRHSTLPAYIQAVRDALGPSGVDALPVVEGELRSCKVQHLLPGVLSARMWIKQRNAAVQTLLERWTEPWAAFAEHLAQQGHVPPTPLAPTREIVRRAWRYLLENQPHDSICGCSVDQVHREMRTRYDWAEQIAETVAQQSLDAIAHAVAAPGRSPALVVFNPLVAPRTDVLEATLELPQSLEEFAIADERGERLPCQVLERTQEEYFAGTFAREELLLVAAAVQDGKVQDRPIREVFLRRDGERARVDVTLGESGAPDPAVLQNWAALSESLMGDESVREVEVRVRSPLRCRVALAASDVPGFGYRAFTVQAASPAPTNGPVRASALRMENEFLVVEVEPRDGTLSILHRPTGMRLAGVNRFVDGGDRGDEYNYCPPERDTLVDAPCEKPVIRLVETGPARATLEIDLLYRVPESLSPDRASRSPHHVVIPITTRVSLAAGVPRCDIQTTLVNAARDHRLRVLVPTPIQTDHSLAEGHYDVVRRSLTLPADTADWIEQPQPTFPQRAFCDVNDGERGVMVAVRGLPEGEVIPGDDGATIAATLLRCVGWLSRDDLATRKWGAGPGRPTPEAQELGEHTFAYAVIPHAGGWEQAFRHAHAFETPMRAAQVAAGGSLPRAASFLAVQPDSLVVTAVKVPEEGDGLIVRVCNYAARAVDAELTFAWPIRRAERVNLAEQALGPLAVDGRTVRVPCGPWATATVRVEA
ncbi:MAG: alpha-mannosidase [Anaerolineales bacterium]